MRRITLCLFLSLLAGCQAARPVEKVEKLSATDPCPERLHELAGPLLEYYAGHGVLPASLSDLDLPGRDSAAWTCPLSHQPYRYTPEGLRLPQVPGRVVVSDATAVHAGLRWALVLIEPDGQKPLRTEVLAIPGEEKELRR